MRRIFDMGDEMMTIPHSRQTGFTLIEAVMVIMITGIIAAAISVFMVGPVKGYFDTARRAEMTDIADTALRRMARDIQAALPNSVRVSGGVYLEFVPITAAGRYRTEKGTATTDDPLDFTAADSSFDVLGPPVTVSNGNLVVIYNLGQTGASVYDMTSSPANYHATNASGSVNKITFAAGVQFPLMSPGNRFQVVSTSVSYVCDLANARLMRYSGYAIQAAQPVSMSAAPLNTATAAVLATNVTACSISYASGAQERNGLATIRLAITEQGETVNLLQQVNVGNTP